jgi:hypothetical protein
VGLSPKGREELEFADGQAAGKNEEGEGQGGTQGEAMGRLEDRQLGKAAGHPAHGHGAGRRAQQRNGLAQVKITVVGNAEGGKGPGSGGRCFHGAILYGTSENCCPPSP